MSRPALRPGTATIAALALLLAAASLWAQVVQVSGGASTLSQSEGGTISVRGLNYGGSLGAGTINGHVFGGGQLVKRMERTTLTLGTNTLPFNFPTDIFDSAHYLTGVGVGVTSQVATTRLRGFAGEVSNQFDSPFFTGVRGGAPALVLYEATPLNPKLTSFANVIVSNKLTAINSLEWNFDGKTRFGGGRAKFAISTGLGSDRPYGAASVSVERSLLSLKAAYYAAPSQFRRADVQTPVTSEADRENIVFTLYPMTRLNLTLARQNYLSPVYGSNANIRSTINQAAATIQVRKLVASGSLLQSTYAGTGNMSFTGSVGAQFGPRISAQETILSSRPQGASATTAFVTNLQETLTPRWGLSQVINTSNGSNTVGFGGSFLSNLATLSAEYQTYYVPARPASPFQQALILDARTHVLGPITLDGSTFVSPVGKLLYTVSAESSISRQAGGSAASPDRGAIGKAGLRGRVVDIAGQPIAGAALLLDQMPLYTDSDGYFYVNERKARLHTFKVLGDRFLDGRRYGVVTSPVIVRSHPEQGQSDLVVVVETISMANR